MPAESVADLPCALDSQARLIREQAETIAHYRKMYDRSSALARIGVWECDLATEALTWTDGVYDLFEIPRGSPLARAEIVDLYEEEARKSVVSGKSGYVRVDHGGRRYIKKKNKLRRS